MAVALLAILTCLSSIAPAHAQADDASNDSVTHRPRLDYESYGLSLDPVDRQARSTGAAPVYAFTRLEAEGGYDSNVRRTADGTTGSAFSVIRPGVALRWDGERHETSLTGQAAIGRYGSSAGDDYEDLSLVAGSRIEVEDDLQLGLSGSAARNHVVRGSDVDLGSQYGTQTYQSYSTKAQVDYTGFAENPMSATLQSTWYRFDDVDGIDRSSLDRWIGSGAARLGLAQAGEFTFFVQPGIQRVDYSDNSGGNPDSTRLDLALGTTYTGGAVTQVTGFAGFSRRTFDQSDTSAEFSALVGADALWNPTDLVTVRSKLSLSNEDSELTAANSVTTTKLDLGVDYAPLDNLFVTGDLNWSDYHYDGDVANRQLFGAGLSTKYLLNEYAYVGAGLRWEDRSSDNPTDEYQATVASLRFGLKLCCMRDETVDGPDGRRLRQGVVNGVFK